MTGSVTYHGEGPVWSTGWGGLRMVDMLAGDVLSLEAGGTLARRHVGSVVAALRPRAGGGAVLALERGFALQDADGTLHPGTEVWRDTGVRMNEGSCDPDGRFYCGSMAYDKTPGAASMYRFDPDGGIVCVLNGLTISNGLAWTLDGTRAYYNDTATHRVDVFDYVDGELRNRRPCVDLSSEGASPDGLTLDSEDGIWVALNGQGQVRRYTGSGELTATIDVPVKQVTACTLGGPDLDELYITTSREGLEPDDEPLAGAVFRAHVDIAGFEPFPFRG